MTTYSNSSRIPVSDISIQTLQAAPQTASRRNRNMVLLVVLGLILVALVILRVVSERAIYMDTLLGYLAFLLGGLVGAGEIISRYRDAPFAALGRSSSFLYLGVNALAAGLAFLLINTFGLTFDTVTDNPAGANALQVLVAGLGAMALFRSAIFTARIAEQEVAIGPHIVLQTVLSAADAGVDRESAKARAPAVKSIMRSVDADLAREVLPLFCYRLLQSSVPEGEYNVMKSKIDDIFKEAEKKGVAAAADGEEEPKEPTETSKAYLLGLTIMNYMGADVLKVAVDTLGSEIKRRPILHFKDIAIEIGEGEGDEAEVTYHVSAEDAEGEQINPICTPSPGETFPVGETTVTCEATDSKTGLRAEGNFKVIVARKATSGVELSSEPNGAIRTTND